MSDSASERSDARFDEFVGSITRALPGDERAAVRDELLSHLHAAREGFLAEGVSEAEAEGRAMASLGPPRRLRRRLYFGLLARDVMSVRYLALVALLASIGFFFVQPRLEALVSRSAWGRFVGIGMIALSSLHLAFPVVLSLFLFAAGRRIERGTALRLSAVTLGAALASYFVAAPVVMAVTALLPSSRLAATLSGPAAFALIRYAVALVVLTSAHVRGGRPVSRAEALLFPLASALSWLALGALLYCAEGAFGDDGGWAVFSVGTPVVMVIDSAMFVLVAVRVAPLARVDSGAVAA